MRGMHRLRSETTPLARRARRWPEALAVVALVLAGCAGGGSSAPAMPGTPGAERLPADPALVTGTLPSGLSYIVRRNENPPGRIGTWLHVATGSLNETEETRGLAHYLEHMAFNGSANFPPGSLIPFFQSLGMSFGRDQNAFTSFDQTVYTLALPDTRPETLDRGLVYLSDVAFRLSLLPEEIERERAIILEEKRARASPRQRVRDEVLARLAPALGRRLPIGTEEAIRSVGPVEFREYYERWYTPSNMTVIAVGDADPARVVEAIARAFEDAPRGPRPEPRPVGVTPATGMRAIVATDAELTQAEVSFTRVEPPRPPVITVLAYRQQLVDRLGTWMFNRRLEAELAEGKVAFQQGGASISTWAGAARIATAQAVAAPERWRSALDDLATALERARQHGFTRAELDEARTALLAQSEQAVRQEATLPARRLLQQINQAVARGDALMSAAQRLALQQRLLPDLSPAEVSRAFASDFEPDRLAVVLMLPAGAGPPAEARLLELARAALDVRPEPPVARVRPASLLAEPPRGGAVVEGREHAATAVWSGWLDNGVRVHHRRVDQRRNEVVITITLAGGVIQERPDSRGVTEAAVSAWNRPATSTLSSTDIRALMTGKKVRVQGSFGSDTVALEVSGDPADLEAGIELAYLLLTAPAVEPAGFEQWRQGRRQEISARALQPRGVLARAEADALYPAGEARLHPLTVHQVDALDRDAAQAWLRGLIAEAPIEVAVVGDIERDRAIALAARYLGALPARARIGDKTLHELRSVPRPAGPIRVTRSAPTQTEQAQVLAGFFASDIQQVRDSRLLVMAARVLSTRMNRVLREERQLVYSIGARLRPGEAYPGFGLLAAQAPTDPAKAAELAEVVEEMFAAFAAAGPSADELAVARQQIGSLLDETMKGPDFWVDRLATLDYRGLSLEDIARIAADYESFTAEAVRDTFARYARPEGHVRLVILPGPPG